MPLFADGCEGTGQQTGPITPISPVHRAIDRGSDRILTDVAKTHCRARLPGESLSRR